MKVQSRLIFLTFLSLIIKIFLLDILVEASVMSYSVEVQSILLRRTRTPLEHPDCSASHDFCTHSVLIIQLLLCRTSLYHGKHVKRELFHALSTFNDHTGTSCCLAEIVMHQFKLVQRQLKARFQLFTACFTPYQCNFGKSQKSPYKNLTYHYTEIL